MKVWLSAAAVLAVSLVACAPMPTQRDVLQMSGLDRYESFCLASDVCYWHVTGAMQAVH